MANRNPNGTLTYWYEGVQCTLITKTPSAPIGGNKYWYYGGTFGFLVDSATSTPARPINFAVLVGF